MIVGIVSSVGMRVTQHDLVLRKRETRESHWGLKKEEKNVNVDNVNSRNVNSNNVNCTDKSH